MSKMSPSTIWQPSGTSRRGLRKSTQTHIWPRFAKIEDQPSSPAHRSSSLTSVHPFEAGGLPENRFQPLLKILAAETKYLPVFVVAAAHEQCFACMTFVKVQWIKSW